MMATEATSETLATNSTTSNHDELNTTESAHQDDPSAESSLVNGNTTDKDGSKQDSESVEAIVHSAEVSVSGGSDTEASKAETSKTGDEKGSHGRSASAVKKFASFKPVSVNKTFLASKGASTAAPSKLGEKPATGPSPILAGSTATLGARPRLVAKSGSGLRDSSPRTAAAANGVKPGGAPDASAVWNKNKPPPPPEVKRFTDEELKQRYGIHLATRLQTDDPGKQANWADIDDDDDDWAPESIEWTDGTKITLPQADEVSTPAASPAPTPVSIPKETKVAEPIKPKSPAPPAQSASPTVKPSGFGSGRTGLILKGAAEKPTLVAKPPGPPTPVKSPWAPLPPVEKVPPIAIEIPQVQPQQPQQTRFGQRDPHSFQGMPPPPAKEIAADDFSRSWREGNSNTSRELFNSQSGRYEPVNDNRRGSRNDVHSRQPAVLQRPHQDGPAEPSAAFQTHRAGGQDAGYGRRRTSSNVSGGSGHPFRRMSRGDMPPPSHDMLSGRRGSLAAVSDAPSSPRNFSPSSGAQVPNQRGYQNQQWQSRASPIVSHHPSPQSVHGQTIPPTTGEHYIPAQPMSAVPQEDPIETQKKIMRQSRELAMKRRQEEEAREEAERKERIRLKLEAMGPPPEKKSRKESPIDAKATPTHIQTREEADSGKFKESAREDVKNTSVKHPESVEDRSSAHKVDTTDADSRSNGIYQGAAGPSTGHQLTSENSRSQPWKNSSTSPPGPSGNDRFTTWASAQQPQNNSSRNLWGPPNTDRPNNERPLGNGTNFVADMSLTSTLPGPIGPPNRNSTYQAGRGRDQFNSRPAPIGPPNRQLSQQQAPARMPLPRTLEQQKQAAQAAAVWGSVPARLQKEDEGLLRQQQEELARNAQLNAADKPQPIIKDTWKQVTLNEDGTRSKPKSGVVMVNDGKTPGWKAPQDDATTRPILEDSANRNDVTQSQSQFNNTWRPSTNMNTSPPVRDSRFFPKNQDVRMESEELRSSFDRPSSPSLPPPTMAGHPAYDGDVAHPHVTLPRPLPVVKLPPTSLGPIAPPRPASFAAAVATPSAPAPTNAGYQGRQDHNSRTVSSYQDVRKSETHGQDDWQARIYNLVRTPNSPPRSHALAVDSSSRTALELPTMQSAAVSLPGSVSGDSGDEDDSVFSKPAAEECFEEQEMGSLPVIKVPHNAPADAWNPAPAQPKRLPQKYLLSDATTTEAIAFPQQINNNASTIYILLPGQTEQKTINLPVPRQKSNPRRGRGGASRNGSSSHPRGGRGKDSINGFSSPNHDNTTPSSSANSSTRGSHRGNRGFNSSTWTRHNPTPINT